MSYKFKILTLLTLLTITVSAVVKAQTILDIFQTLPDSVILNLSKSDRKMIVQLSKDNITNEDAIADLKLKRTKYAFEKADVKNRYLKLIGSFEGKLEIASWPLPNDCSLIGVYKESCGPVCSVAQMNFFRYSKTSGFTWLPLNYVLPVAKIEQYLTEHFSSTDTLKKDKMMDKILYQLPQKGKDILLKCNDEYKEYNYCSTAVIVTMRWLPENLKNENYFGIK